MYCTIPIYGLDLIQCSTDFIQPRQSKQDRRVIQNIIAQHGKNMAFSLLFFNDLLLDIWHDSVFFTHSMFQFFTHSIAALDICIMSVKATGKSMSISKLVHM